MNKSIEEKAFDAVKKEIPWANIFDGAKVNGGVVLFGEDIQPQYYTESRLRGLNGNAPEDAKIIAEAELIAGYKGATT